MTALRIRTAWRRAADLRLTSPVILGACLLVIPAAGGAATTAPDPMTLDVLHADLSRAKAVRVTSASGVHVLRDVRLDSSGVASARWGPGGRERPALIVGSDAMPPPTPRPISWSEISRIETGKTSAGLSGLKGLVLGVLVGTVLWSTIPTGEPGGQGPAHVVIGVPAVVGFAFGAFLGSQQYHWSAIYPRATEAGAR